MAGRSLLGILAGALLLAAPVSACGAASTSATPPPAAGVGSGAAPTNDAARGQPSSATRGRITCGDQSCDLTSEVCCQNDAGAGRCEPRPTNDGASPCTEGELEKRCDERTDCGDGAVCCRTYDCSGGCPPKLDCEPTRCQVEMSEACLGSDGCGADFECRMSDSRQGFCALARPGVPCGAARCADERPMCRVDEKGATCIPVPDDLGPPNPQVTYLACAAAADCGGYACGKMADMPHRVFRCAAPGFAGDRFWPILCAALSDCPAHWGRKASACAPATDGAAPPFVKVCVYPEDD